MEHGFSEEECMEFEAHGPHFLLAQKVSGPKECGKCGDKVAEEFGAAMDDAHMAGDMKKAAEIEEKFHKKLEEKCAKPCEGVDHEEMMIKECMEHGFSEEECKEFEAHGPHPMLAQ